MTVVSSERDIGVIKWKYPPTFWMELPAQKPTDNPDDVKSDVPGIKQTKSGVRNKNTYCPRSVLSASDDPGTYFPAARLISLR